MTLFKIHFDWFRAGGGAPEIQQTTGFFRLVAGGVNVTENEDTWSRTIRENVLLSAYPLATWLSSSWWRLLHEPLPPRGIRPSADWRMAHEATAANEGFLWPRIVIAPDGESILVWATSSPNSENQSVRYMNGLAVPVAIGCREFEHETASFIHSVIERLEAVGVHESALSSLWREVLDETNDPHASEYRQREAEMGFDTDECPEAVVEEALALSSILGKKTLSEVAPAYGRYASEESRPLAGLQKLIASYGFNGKPLTPAMEQIFGVPWKRGGEAARRIRKIMDIGDNPLSTEDLCEVLGVKSTEVEEWSPPKEQRVSLAAPQENGGLRFHLRKRHPVAKRFELARLLGDYLQYGEEDAYWLASTDLRTSRQKYQRAFAAEFLSPLSGLQEFIGSDFSESMLEDAAAYYGVSTQAVESMLVNNGIITPSQIAVELDNPLPY
jgi:Zn-dependent peptidase ImmA (M78 family)